MATLFGGAMLTVTNPQIVEIPTHRSFGFHFSIRLQTIGRHFVLSVRFRSLRVAHREADLVMSSVTLGEAESQLGEPYCVQSTGNIPCNV